MDDKTQQDGFHLPQPVPDVPTAPTGQDAAVQAPASSPVASADQVNAKSTAVDSDTLDPVWVRAVEALNRQMAEDPRRLSEELGKLKARYIKERYGMEIKTPQEKA